MDSLGAANGALGAVNDAVGDAWNSAFDLDRENIGGIFTNMTLLSMLLMSLKDKPFPKTCDNFENKPYDYIIVGAGTAGCVMANRLSEIPYVNVLLLEAGGYPPYISEIPSVARLLYGTDIDWLYYSTPQKYGAFGQIDNKVPWNSGKGLGGGSVLNAMLYIRGNKENYNQWEREGCIGWGFKDVLPYFNKIEDNRNFVELDEGYHGENGPMTVGKPRYTPDIQDAIYKALFDLRFRERDINGECQTGIYDPQFTIRNGLRCSTAKAYLVPAEDRPNLTILKRAFVEKIIFRGGRAVGVQFSFKGEKQIAYCRKEVIVSSGSVRAAQLLMLSGIGPREHLAKFGIRVRRNLPVGQNLQDHIASYLNFELSPLVPSIALEAINPENVVRFVANKEGPLASPTQINTVLFSDGLDTANKSTDFPRQELYFAEYATIDPLKNYNLKPEVFAQVYAKYTPLPLYTCIISLLQPYSRGEILLNSADPYDPPIIDPNYYKDERDLWDVVEGMRICKKVGEHEELKKLGSKLFDTVFPGCVDKQDNETEALACQARQMITSFWHPVGTCRMGQPRDPKSVVDTHLRVIGVPGLRVVCAAVMPIIPSGNTNIPTMMVAEKIAAEMQEEITRSNRQPRRG